MNAMSDIRNHDHADTLLDDYVMGTLSAADLAWMDQHIPTCDICQVEVPLFLEAAFALPFGVNDPPVAMGDDLWDRIAGSLEINGSTNLDRDVSESSLTPDPTATWPARPNQQAFVPLNLDETGPAESEPGRSNVTFLQTYKWFALAAAAILLLGLGAVVAQNLWWSDDESSNIQTIAMVDANGNAIESSVANLEYSPDNGMLILHMEDMPTAPEGQIYQAWLIAGDVPVPIGTVDPTSGEFEHEVSIADYDAFAITVEPAPDGSDLPTTTPIVVAPLVPEI